MKIIGRQSGFPANSRQHSGTDLLAIMKSEDELGQPFLASTRCDPLCRLITCFRGRQARAVLASIATGSCCDNKQFAYLWHLLIVFDAVGERPQRQSLDLAARLAP